MKYALIIIDGAADEPLAELGGKTPLEAADLPAMDRLAREGILGTARTCPSGLPCGSDVAIMSVMGYDPSVYYTGRAPLEAAARAVPLEDTDWVFRANTVTLADGIMKDNTADNIAQADAEKIMALLNEELCGPEIEFHAGVGYRNLLVVHKPMKISTTPPHDILDQPVAGYMPQGASAPFLIDLYERCRALLARAPVAPAANAVWFWGEGRKPRLESFRDRYGLSAAAITAVDLVRGLARLSGWDVVEVPGATAYFDTNYRGKGERAAAALADHDLVCVHVEAPDEAGHKGAPREKIRALENIDRHIVGPLLETLERSAAGWRVLLLPDHPTPCAIRTHTHDPVPFALAGSDISGGSGRTFTENEARLTGVFVEGGHTLMRRFVEADRKRSMNS
ncbi:MAG: cofactor-independent phosphoglycerate mutase [Spirochaetales bacterium]|nr:cofactor-independent phosphoglycerate mutase [Spirochaetales bacterium]